MFYPLTRASLMTQRVKNLPAKQETQIQPLGWEDSLEKEMAAQSGILAQRIPWTEEPGGLQSTRLQRVGHEWVTNTHTHPLTNIALSHPVPSPWQPPFYCFYESSFLYRCISPCVIIHEWVQAEKQEKNGWSKREAITQRMLGALKGML